MGQEKLETLSFHEWWTRYNDTHKHDTGGKEWSAAFAAWQYSGILTKQKSAEPAKNFMVQMKAAEKMNIQICCPCCGGDDLRLIPTLGQVKYYRCNKCEPEMPVE